MNRSLCALSLFALAVAAFGVSHDARAGGTVYVADCTGGGTYCITGSNTDSGGYGVIGYTGGGGGIGVTGEDEGGSASAGDGVYGISAYGNGVYGVGQAGSAIGVKAEFTGGGAGYGLYADTTATTGSAIAVYGKSNGSSGTGVYGYSSSTTGSGNGVYGTAASAYANGVTGENTDGGTGVYGQTSGTASTSFGVYGVTFGGVSSIGVNGVSVGDGTGVKGTSTSGTGVYGVADSGLGIGGFGVTGASGWGTQVGVEGITSGTTSSSYAIYGIGNGGSTWAGYFEGNVYATGTYSSSDERLKKNIQPLQGSLDQLMRLQGVTFEWKEPDEHGRTAALQRGFVAQDVEKVFPDWVGVDGKGFKAIDVHQIEALEVESIRELKLRNDKLQADYDKMKASFEDRLSVLEGNGHTKTSGLGFLGNNNNGWIFGGLTFAGALVMSRRKKSEGRP
jgi:hypothetical protein